MLADYGIPFDPGLVAHGNFKESGGAAAAEQLLSRCRDGFDALVAASDNMAIGVLHVLQAHGLRVPGDVAIAGLNDESQSPFVTPPLTTGPLHFYEQARRATEMLLALLASVPVTGQVILPTQLLIRQSCGCPDPLVTQAAVGHGHGERRITVRCVDRPARAHHRRDAAGDRGRADRGRRAPGPCSSWTVSPPRSPAARRAHSSKPWATVCAAALPTMSRSPGGRARFALRRELIACVCGRRIWGAPRTCGSRPGVMVGETAQRVQAYRVLLQAEEQARTLGAINQMLSTAIDLPELTEILARALPQLGIPSGYLALEPEPGRPHRLLPADGRLRPAGPDRGAGS